MTDPEPQRELSWRAFLLGCLLSAILAGANAYLGLFAGMTVSASIPAAVLSMGLLRFVGGTIQENNLVQTAASAGESVAAGVIFTLPALLLLGVWDDFGYVQTVILAGFGGVLGVLFTIPLRRALLDLPSLRFPEGVATAEVLQAGHRKGSTDVGRLGVGETGTRSVVLGAVVGGACKLSSTGFKLWPEVVEGARSVGSSVAYVGMNLSPALLAVGYIVGLEIAVLVFLGGALNWWVAIPLVAAFDSAGSPGGEAVGALDQAWTIWSTKTRYLGVGAMVVGGLWALIDVRKTLVSGVRAGLAAYRELQAGVAVPRRERDLPMQWVAVALALSLIPLTLVFWQSSGSVIVGVVLAPVLLVAGFLFCSVAAYMAGLVGSSNNPVSGVTIATILLTSLLLLALLGPESAVGPGAAILLGSVVCCAAAIGGDNVQDLKAGQLVGATPYRQQILQIAGVVAAALVLAPVLNLLLEAYGIGAPTGAHPKPLRAPQATLMAAVARGVFEGGLPWTLVGIGAVVAGAVIALDRGFVRRGSRFRIPVLAVAVGIYLPLELSVPILVGGLIAFLAGRSGALNGAGLLLAAGLITGEALSGIGLAVPIVMTGGAEGWALDVHFPVLGVMVFALVGVLLFRAARGRPSKAA